MPGRRCKGTKGRADLNSHNKVWTRTHVRYWKSLASAPTLLMLCSLAACGVFETSTYSPSPTNGARKGTQNPDSKSKIEKTTDLSGTRDLNFDTGLTQCVKETFNANQTLVFAPIKHTKALTDFVSLQSLENDSDFLILFDLILRTIVSPSNGLVQYSRLRAGGDLKPVWSLIMAHLPKFQLSALTSENARLAFWTNAYNLVMIDILVNDATALLTANQKGTFEGTMQSIGGKDFTLSQIEYGVLRLNGGNLANDAPAESKPEGIERRLHAALVCGARSCPKLRNFAYEPEALDVILNENIHMFFNDTTNHLIPSNQESPIRFSQLFKWFPSDFDAMAGNTSAADAARFLLPSCRQDKDALTELFTSLGSFSQLPQSQVITYDWTVNEQQ
jgi:hypothetical protein